MALPILARTITNTLVKKAGDAKKDQKKVSTQKLLPGSGKSLSIKSSKYVSKSSPSLAIRPRVSMVKVKPAKIISTPKIGEKFDRDKLDDLLKSLIGNTKQLEKTTKKDLNDQKKENKNKRNTRQKLKRQSREDKIESKAIKPQLVKSSLKLPKVPDFFKDIMSMGGRFILATGIMSLLNYLTDTKRRDGIFKFLEDNIGKVIISAIGLTAASVLLPLTPLFGAVLGLGKILLAPLAIALGFVGKIAKKALGIIRAGARAAATSAKNLFRKPQQLRIPAGIPLTSQPTTGGAGRYSRTDARGNQIATKGKIYQDQLNRVGPAKTSVKFKPGSLMSRLNSARANLQTGTLLPRGANLQRSLYRLPGQVSKVSSSALRYGKTLLATTKGLMGRVPFIGAILEGIMTYFEDADGDGKPDKKIDKALFNAGGTAIGGLLGSFIPIPFLGTLLGSIVGKYFGELVYELLRGGGWKAVAKKIQRDTMAALNTGKAALEWIGGGFKRFYQSLDKKTIPKKLGFIPIPPPLGGLSIIDPKYLKILNLNGNNGPELGGFFELGGLLMKAFFQGKSKNGKSNLMDLPEPEIRGYDSQNMSPTAVSGLTNIVPLENMMKRGVYSGGGITDNVGMTSGRGMRNGSHHRGIDIGTSNQKGWYVSLMMNGIVSDVGTFSGYGETVVITAEGKDYLFGHLALGKILVKKGDRYMGTPIGEIGNTGRSSGEHLHFEVSPAGTGGYGKDEDPMPYVKYLKIGKLSSEPVPQQVQQARLSSTNTPTVEGIDQRASYEDQSGNETVIITVKEFVPLPSGATSGASDSLSSPGMKDVNTLWQQLFLSDRHND